MPRILKPTCRYRIDEVIAYIVEPSAESNLEELASYDSFEDHVPDEGEYTNDVNIESNDEPSGSDEANKEINSDLDIEKFNSKKPVLRQCRWRKKEPLLYDAAFTGQFTQLPPETDGFTFLHQYQLFLR